MVLVETTGRKIYLTTCSKIAEKWVNESAVWLSSTIFTTKTVLTSGRLCASERTLIDFWWCLCCSKIHNPANDGAALSDLLYLFREQISKRLHGCWRAELSMVARQMLRKNLHDKETMAALFWLFSPFLARIRSKKSAWRLWRRRLKNLSSLSLQTTRKAFSWVCWLVLLTILTIKKNYRFTQKMAARRKLEQNWWPFLFLKIARPENMAPPSSALLGSPVFLFFFQNTIPKNACWGRAVKTLHNWIYELKDL